MTGIQLLGSLSAQGVQLWEEAGRLRYRAPKGVMNEMLLAELADKKNEIILLLRDRKKDFAFNLPQIVPDPQQLHRPFPLTDIQHAYLIGRNEAYELGNIACHGYFELECESLDVERLNFAWQSLIERHDMLRAIILPDGTQQILDQVPSYKIEILDLRGEAPDVMKSRLDAIRNSMSHQVLKFDQWPLFELRASRLDDNFIRLHMSLDLLIADFYSMQILFKELLLLYNDHETPLVPLELSFRDYVLAEANLRDSDLYNRSRHYWLSRLSTLPTAPELPLAKNPGSVTQPRFVRRSFRLEPQTCLRLKTRASWAGLTLSGVLLAAYAEVLSSWSKNPRFCINLTLLNRLPLHPQVMDIVGDFTCVSLLEVNNSHEATTFEERARRLQGQLWRDMDYRYFSGVRVIRELTRGKSRTSGAIMPVVFTSTIGLGSSSQDDFDVMRLGKIIYSITQTPQVWLDHQITEQAGAVDFNWDAVQGLFPEGLLDDMFDAYCRLLYRLANEEEAWQETTFKLIPAYQLEKRADVNATDTSISSEMLHTLFAAQVSQRSKESAVVSSNRSLSYEELSCRSNRVGRLLREKGAQPNTLVAVVMEKGWEQVVAVLGILNSGAAYLPVDPAAPKERLWHLLNDGKVSLILTQSWLDEKLEWPDHVQCFSVDKIEPGNEIHPPKLAQEPDALAYVIYTSGSTGLPKGVMIDHRGAVNTILDVNQRFGVGPGDKVLALSNLNFDLSVYDIFGTLAAGGTIVLPDASGTKDPAHWLQLMTQEQVTIWNSVPALMQMFVEYVSGRADVVPQSLRLALLSGDWIPLDLPDKIKAMKDGVQVISLGGATEASIWSTLYSIEEVDPNWKSIPYGRPMVNQRIYVLNEFMEDCPDWVPGQLYIGGIGLAQGYWRDEDKTKDSFDVHPRTGERLYRTGDLGRYLPDGNIEFLGREDFQVKIRGYRIELGEIETTVKQHPGVRDAVVTAVGETQGNKRLVSYVVPDQDKESSLFETESADPTEIQTRWDSLVEAGHQQAQQVPEGLNLQTHTIFWQRMEKLSILSICRTLTSLGVFVQPRERHSIEDLVYQCQIQDHYQKLLGQWLRVLEEEGLLIQEGETTFVNPLPLPMDSLDVLWQEVRQYANWGAQGTQAQWGAQAQAILYYVQRSSENHIALLKGEVDPLELLFPKGSWQTAESLYKLNPAAEYYNSIARKVLRLVAKGWRSGKQLRILEVGAGTGSTTASLLPVLQPDQTIYTYTDISTFFTNEAEKKFKSYPFVRYGLLDINQNPQHQGYEAHSFDVIVAVNVLHDARNIGTTLRSLRSLLAPGGLLLIVEGTRNRRLQMISVGFLEGFSHFEDERLKDNLPLLSVEKWQKALRSSGFEEFVAFPESSSYLTEVFGHHVIVAQAPSSVKWFKSVELRNFLAQKLPEYMVPSSYILLDVLPLTPNGKIDRQALPMPDDQEKSDPERTFIAPRTPVETSLVEMWAQVLRVDVEHVSIHDDFFKSGGDSLLAIQFISQVRNKYQVELMLQSLYECPTISHLADLIKRNPISAMTII